MPVTLAARAPSGPDVLRQPAFVTPLLQSRSTRFVAAPIMVSGQEAYQNGEYFYQDHIFDDYGADTQGTPADINVPATYTSPATGTATPDAFFPNSGEVTYPTNTARYGNNAADLVEFRISPGATDVAYRITLNTLLEKDSTLVVIAWDRDRNAATGASTLPRDPGIAFPGTDEVIYLWGTGGEHRDLITGTVTPLAVDTDLASNQMTVFVPRTVHNPTGTWDATVATGLYDPATGGFLRPGATASATAPGGAGPADPTPPGLFNVAFRFDELCLTLDAPCDTRQAVALRGTGRSLAPFKHGIDFARLAAGSTTTTVPASGSMIRLFASRLPEPEGRDYSLSSPNTDSVEFGGTLQPYGLYVPKGYQAGTPAPLTWAGHSILQYHYQYLGTRYTQQVAEARGSLLATPLSRSHTGFYVGRNEYDTFEVWADILRHYAVDMARVNFTGYSMGGYFTYRYASLYPDLTAKGFSQVGPPGAGTWNGSLAASTVATSTLTNVWLENLRNVPMLNMAMVSDEEVPQPGPRVQNAGGSPEAGVQSLDGLGYRYRYLEVTPGEHNTMYLNDDYPFATDFLGTTAIDPSPAHVTFSYVPATDAPTLGLVHDRAYWVSGLRLRNPTATGAAPAKGTFDGISAGRGQAEPVVGATAHAPGTLPGNVGMLTYLETSRAWADPVPAAADNRLTATFTNLQTVQVDMLQAKLDPAKPFTLASTADGATVLNLFGTFGANRPVYEDGVRLCTATAGPGGAQIPLKTGTHTYEVR